ncbi:MAG: anthranilate phosphoribosyltransferase [Phycisphaerae bacterium]|nr:anthranilate phosphoribosyltransferase [Phycisphaerae bacterium]
MTPFIRALAAGRTLARQEAVNAFESMMSGQAHHAEMGALLALLATRVPTVDELVGAATVMRANVDRVDSGGPADKLLDTAGTGGTAKLFNVSTAAAVVAAAAGVRVAKHGNRSRTARGSAEVLAELGVNVDCDRAAQRRCLRDAGICFCFAVHHHPAAKHAMPVRKALGIPTIFNLLGPLTNPAGAGCQLVGVYAPQFVRPVADALATLGCRSALVVHGTDGLDEVSLSAPTLFAEVSAGSVTEGTIVPEDAGLERASHEALQTTDLADAANLFRALLTGAELGPKRRMLLLNAAAALRAAGVIRDWRKAVQLAEHAIDSGAAAKTLDALVRGSNSTA